MHPGMVGGLRHGRGEAEASGLQSGREQIVEPRFQDRGVSVVQGVHADWIDVDTQDVMTEGRQARGMGGPEISGTEDGDLHTPVLSRVVRI